MVYFFLFLLVIAIGIYFFTHKTSFGAMPQGERLKRIKSSPNHNGVSFQNQEYVPMMTGGGNMFKTLWQFLVQKNANATPQHALPTKKTNLMDRTSSDDGFVWMGHSSYFIQLEGCTMLVDPVFSGSASPLRGMIKAFEGSDVYSAEDMPPIDLLIITHDHWDHLDYSTVIHLKDKIQHIVCPLGVGAHLERWGFQSSMISELDWTEKCEYHNITIVSTPAQHFSGRSFKRNTSLWSSFVVISKNYKLFLSGDGGYGKHFADIGDFFGPFDCAFIENGQYDDRWKNIHLHPEQVKQVALDLKARKVLPTHSSKFKLAMHNWNDPLSRIAALSKNANFQLLTPQIGEYVPLNRECQTFYPWWM